MVVFSIKKYFFVAPLMKHVSKKILRGHVMICMRIATTVFLEDRLYDVSFFFFGRGK